MWENCTEWIWCGGFGGDMKCMGCIIRKEGDGVSSCNCVHMITHLVNDDVSMALVSLVT